MRFILTIFITFFTAWGSVSAANTISASDPRGIYEYLVNMGETVILTTDEQGDPNIRVDYNGTKFRIFFYDCKNNQNCHSIQFYAGYQTANSWNKTQSNTWNTNQRYAKSYISPQGHARLEMDIYTGKQGIRADIFLKNYTLWTDLMTLFEKEIGW